MASRYRQFPPLGGYGCFYDCFLVIEAHGGRCFRTPCPIVVRNRSNRSCTASRKGTPTKASVRRASCAEFRKQQHHSTRRRRRRRRRSSNPIPPTKKVERPRPTQPRADAPLFTPAQEYNNNRTTGVLDLASQRPRAGRCRDRTAVSFPRVSGRPTSPAVI